VPNRLASDTRALRSLGATQPSGDSVDSATRIPLKVEPPAAQQIYAVLDTAMQGVLTDRNANIDKLLSDAEKQVNQILAAQPK